MADIIYTKLHSFCLIRTNLATTQERKIIELIQYFLLLIAVSLEGRHCCYPTSSAVSVSRQPPCTCPLVLVTLHPARDQSDASPGEREGGRERGRE